MTIMNRLIIIFIIIITPCFGFCRYYDAKLGRWVSPDPVLDRYLPNPLDKKQQNNNFIPEVDLPAQGGVYDPINLNLYHYAGNNPIKYIDPDGLLKRDANGNLIFWKPQKRGEAGFSNNVSIKGYWGYLTADDGTKITAFLSKDPSKEISDRRDYTFDCHGFTFADGLCVINGNEVEKILTGDNYKKHNGPVVGDVVIFRATEKLKHLTDTGNVGEIYHSAKVIGVDLENGTFTVQEKIGQLKGIQTKTYKIENNLYKVEFYNKQK